MRVVKDLKALMLEIKKSIENCYIYVSTSPYLLEEAAEAFIKNAREREKWSIEIKKYSARELDISLLSEEAYLLPLFSRKKLIWIKDVHLLKDAKKGNFEETVLGIMKVNYIVVTGNMDAVNLFKEKDLVKRIYNLVEPYGIGLIEWIQFKVAQDGKEIDRGAAEALIRIIGTDLGEIRSELTKLICYTGERRIIRHEDVEDMYPFLKNRRLVELVGALKKGDIATSIQIADNLLVSEDPLRILSYLFTVVKKEFMIAKINNKDYREMLSYFHSADLLLKSSKIPARIVLHDLIIKTGNHIRGISLSKVH